MYIHNVHLFLQVVHLGDVTNSNILVSNIFKVIYILILLYYYYYYYYYFQYKLKHTVGCKASKRRKNKIIFNMNFIC